MDRGKSVKVVASDKLHPIDKLCQRAEHRGIYNVESLRRGVCYMYEDDEIAIVTNRGYLLMSVETADVVAEELAGLIEDIKDMRRMQCRK